MTENTRTAVADETEVGSYFVANYPPFSVWTREGVQHDAIPAQQAPPAQAADQWRVLDDGAVRDLFRTSEPA